MSVRLEWDEAKNISNKRKHGVTFQQAVKLFDDPLYITEWDSDVHGEERWKSFGIVGSVLLIAAAHTIREADGSTVIRLISARKASNEERRFYENENR